MNELYHQPPSFKTGGVENTKVRDPHHMNALSDRENIRLPPAWRNNPMAKTYTQLKSDRRRAPLPHPSFDLNGDGNISVKEYAVANYMDKDKDGRLNTHE